MIADFLLGEREQAVAAAARSALLMLLRAVPSTFAVAPRLWVPRQVRQQVGATLRGLVADAAATADAAPGDANAEIAHLLCRAGPQLLLRYPPEQSDADAVPDSVTGPGALSLLRGRLTQSARGRVADPHWRPLGGSSCAADRRSAGEAGDAGRDWSH